MAMPCRTFFYVNHKILIMNPLKSKWNKEELKIYILLLCAKADKVEVKEELNLIKTKTSAEIFDTIYREFQNDSEDESLEKIQDVLERHQYSELELCELKNEI